MSSYSDVELEKRRVNQRAWYARKREYIDEQKEGKPCMDCGGLFNPWQMDFDHRPGEIKIAGIATMYTSSASIKDIKQEITKCDLICANCHRERTHDRMLVAKNN